MRYFTAVFRVALRQRQALYFCPAECVHQDLLSKKEIQMRPNRSMRIGIALIVVALVVLGLFLVVNAFRPASKPTVVQGPAATQVALPATRRAAIALVDMPDRSIITPNMFRMEALPEGAESAGYITDPDSQAIGFITRRKILANERIRTSDLVGHISEVGIAGALRPGTRAMMLPIPTKPTFHDLVRIGDYIDVIAAFDGQESRTIVENVRVLAIDVFGKDYPPTSVALRGSQKAPPRSIGGANVASPQPATANSGDGSQAPSTPAPGQPAPAPTPTPTPAPQAAPPAPALTIEVTPEQANRISLAQNAGAAIDFILVPPPQVGALTPGATATEVSVNRAQLAPYANSKKGSGDTPAKKSTPSARRVSSPPENFGPSFPPLPPPVGGDLPPAQINTQTPSATYDIPIYMDGKQVRTDTVRKPK